MERDTCLALTVKEFAEALQTGVYSGGFLYPNERVLLGTVVTAITAASATIRRCLNDGRKSDATIWQGDHWYMLWHHQKELALHIPILKRVVGYFEIFTVIRWFFLIPLLILSGPYISEPERKSAEPL